MILRMIYSRFLDPEGREVSIGGIQTYLQELAGCAAEIGLKTVLYQQAVRPFLKEVGLMSIHGVVVDGSKPSQKIWRELYDTAAREMHDTGDILLFGTDVQSVRTNYSRAILIQHGIYWDTPKETGERLDFLKACSIFRAILTARRHLQYIKTFENCRNRICVDYNYQNWYRTFRIDPQGKNTWVIPNFAPILPEQEIRRKMERTKPNVSILFARRFEKYRGTRLMAETVSELLPVYKNVFVTFAGDGPDRNYLCDKFKDESRVVIKKVEWDKRMSLNYDHDIAVIPSLGSEGTSLSLAEAMAAGCVVIASDVGGMTNMVLDEHNGLIIPATVRDLKLALYKVIENSSLRKELATNGYNTARDAFSKTKWQNKWQNVLKYLTEQKV